MIGSNLFIGQIHYIAKFDHPRYPSFCGDFFFFFLSAFFSSIISPHWFQLWAGKCFFFLLLSYPFKLKIVGWEDKWLAMHLTKKFSLIYLIKLHWRTSYIQYWWYLDNFCQLSKLIFNMPFDQLLHFWILNVYFIHALMGLYIHFFCWFLATGWIQSLFLFLFFQ